MLDGNIILRYIEEHRLYLIKITKYVISGYNQACHNNRFKMYKLGYLASAAIIKK